jgi:hypothetical protein
VDLLNEAVVVVDLAVRTSPLVMTKCIGDLILVDNDRVLPANTVDVKMRTKYVSDVQSAVQTNDWLRIRRLSLDLVSYFKRRYTRQ